MSCGGRVVVALCGLGDTTPFLAQRARLALFFHRLHTHSASKGLCLATVPIHGVAAGPSTSNAPHIKASDRDDACRLRRGQARSRRKLNIVLLGLEELREKGMGPLLNFNKFQMMGRPLENPKTQNRTSRAG